LKIGASLYLRRISSEHSEEKMCWSLTVSAAMVAVGSAATVYTQRRGLPRAIWMAIGYFTLMEALQAAGYFVVDACGAPANRLITILSYLHIAFQPFFINAFAMYLIPDQISKRVRVTVYCLCSASAAFMLLQLYPFSWAGSCRIGEMLCGSELCLRSGEWHIAWDIPYNGLATKFYDLLGINWGCPTYALTAFMLPVLYGSWRFPIFHYLAGPVAAWTLTRDVNEGPAIWCLFSIGIILIPILPVLMRQFRVEHWCLWPESWTAEFVHE
jgi:hypothetical protein